MSGRITLVKEEAQRQGLTLSGPTASYDGESPWWLFRRWEPVLGGDKGVTLDEIERFLEQSRS